jgi:hypothetical protein
MSTTSAYGWNIPDNTDLVKDGALAIRTLGNAIDTSMNTALGTKKSGMVLLQSLTFSAVASQQITSIFSATYDNYFILVYGGTGSANVGVGLTLGATSTGYYNKLIYGSYGDNTVLGSGNSNGSNFVSAAVTGTSGISGQITLLNPFLTKETMFFANNAQGNTSGSFVTNGGFLNNTTSYTAFTLTPTSGTMTGSVSVYGYNK